LRKKLATMPEFAISSRSALAFFVSKQPASSLSDPRPYLAVIGKQTGPVPRDAEDRNPPGNYQLPATTERPASLIPTGRAIPPQNQLAVYQEGIVPCETY
jgi:hypothetical protein